MRTAAHTFNDPTRHADVTLHVDPALPMHEGVTVAHGRCPDRADVTIELDAYYCSTCGWRGRISGAWAAEMWELAGIEATTIAGQVDELGAAVRDAWHEFTTNAVAYLREFGWFLLAISPGIAIGLIVWAIAR